MSRTQGIFESVFGTSTSKFNSVTDVDAFVEQRTGKALRVSTAHGRNFVLAQGNVFPLVDYNVDDMVDRTLKGQGWLKRLVSRM